jgi:hypothetical protein
VEEVMATSVEKKVQTNSQLEIVRNWKRSQRVYRNIDINKASIVSDESVIFGERITDMACLRSPQLFSTIWGCLIIVFGVMLCAVGVVFNYPNIHSIGAIILIFGTISMLFNVCKEHQSVERLMFTSTGVSGEISWCPKVLSCMQIETFELKWSDIKEIGACRNSDDGSGSFSFNFELKRAVEIDSEPFDNFRIFVATEELATDVYNCLKGLCSNSKFLPLSQHPLLSIKQNDQYE